MSSKSKTKIYFWLKLDNNFYKNLAIKKARRLAGGDTMVIIYQKLMLESLQNNGDKPKILVLVLTCIVILVLMLL